MILYLYVIDVEAHIHFESAKRIRREERLMVMFVSHFIPTEHAGARISCCYR